MNGHDDAWDAKAYASATMFPPRIEAALNTNTGKVDSAASEHQANLVGDRRTLPTWFQLRFPGYTAHHAPSLGHVSRVTGPSALSVLQTAVLKSL